MKSDLRPPVNVRTYDTSRRRAAATQRRERVLEAARHLFVARGYAGATMGEIAERAGVSIKTVEAAFGTKGALLKRVVDVAIAGDDEQVAVVDRPIVEQLREESDVGRFLDLYASMVTDISARLAPLAAVIEHGAQNDTEIERLRRTMIDNRMFGARHIAELLHRTLRRPEGGTERTADVLFLFNDPLIYRTLVLERDWTKSDFSSWLAGTYQALLAAP